MFSCAGKKKKQGSWILRQGRRRNLIRRNKIPCSRITGDPCRMQKVQRLSNKNNTSGDSMGGGGCGKWGGRAGRSETAKICVWGAVWVVSGGQKTDGGGGVWETSIAVGWKLLWRFLGIFVGLWGFSWRGFSLYLIVGGGEGKGFLGFFLGVTKMANNELEERERERWVVLFGGRGGGCEVD